jgi:hypothetical protein
MSLTFEQASAASAAVQKECEQLAPVASVGVARIDGGFGLKVNLRRAPRRGAKIPQTVQGVPVRFAVTGDMMTFDAEADGSR